jgi:hypothetical protein
VAERPDPSEIAPGIDDAREALLRVLVRHEVAFVVIGGAAIQSHGRRYDTLDVDLTPDTDQENLKRLAAALNELDCRLVTDPSDTAAWVPLPPGYFTPPSLLAASAWNLSTRHGQLDLSFAPSGFPGGYAELKARASRKRLAGTSVTVPVAALEDVHTSKRAANRPKDRAYLLDADGRQDEQSTR